MRVPDAPRGRARAINTGAGASACDVLLFLHADTSLPSNARQAILTALVDAACVGGRFNVRFRLLARVGPHHRRSDEPALALERHSPPATRRSLSGARRFETMGGFADIPLMEDIDFTRRLKRTGPVVSPVG